MHEYITYTKLTDSGPYITKLILKLPCTVFTGSVAFNTFSVFVRRRHRKTKEVIRHARKNFSPEAVTDTADGLSQGYCKVVATYPCDKTGVAAYSSNYLALDLSYGPLEPLICRIAPASKYLNDFVDTEICITQTAPIPGAPECMGLVFNTCAADIRPALEGWQFNEKLSDVQPLRYGWFSPQKGTAQKYPLLVWLHGAGGGGDDPRVPVQNNRVTSFSSQLGQQKLDTAWVLVPQCPTLWMDDGKGTPLFVNNESMYIQAVKHTVDFFIAQHAEEIDCDRVYVAGSSNGGFMAVMQAITYPHFYAAAVPVCEAVLTDKLMPKDIDALKEIPLWFVHAKNDFVVDPQKTVVPLYKKLIAAGAKNLHFTYWDNIQDQTGVFINPNHSPYQYIGHFAWVPTLNDECKLDYNGQPVTVDGCSVGIFEWLAHQRKRRR